MKIAWSELVKFLRNNIKKLVIGIIITALTFAGLSYMFGRNSIENLRGTVEIEGIEEDAKSAHFLFYIEDRDNNMFTNNLLIEQYITMPEILEQASEETDTNLDEIVMETDNEAVIRESNTNVIGVNRDGSSQLLEFYINIGNERKNLDIANYFYDYIMENEIPFLEDKTIFVFQEPQIEVIDEETLEDSINLGEEPYNIIMNLIIGSIFGAIAVLFILFILTLFSKKIEYSFSYSVLEQDYFFLINEDFETEDELVELLTSPINARKVIIKEENTDINNNKFNEILNNLKNPKNLECVNSILKIENIEKVDRLIFIISENSTSRKWYNKQRSLIKNLDISSVILHVNED